MSELQAAQQSSFEIIFYIVNVNLNTDLQALAVRITLDKTTTLCSVYIPPNSSLSLTQLKHLADQLPTPFIIMGDFNGHNPLWGSKTTTDKGKKT
jgi:hypothetical protein